MQSKKHYFLLPYQTMSSIPSTIKRLYFYGFGREKEYTKLVITSSEFTQLQSIVVGNECFRNVREFVVDGLKKLKNVKIGCKCFTISYKERDDGLLRITNCPNLCQLDIGSGSAYDFKRLELSNVNSLQSIQFGSGCFQFANEFVLESIFMRMMMIMIC